MIKTLFVLLFFVFCASSKCISQELVKTRDLGLWTGVSYAFKLSETFSVKATQEIRLFESVTKLEKSLTDIGLKYKINEEFSLGSNLRYYFDRKRTNEITQDVRYSFDLNFRKKLSKKQKLFYRARYQTAYEEPFGATLRKGGVTANFRNQIGFSYKTNKRNKLYLKAEMFREIKNLRRPYFNKFRISLGYQVKWKKNNLNCSINMERDLNSAYPLLYSYLRLKYNFKK